MMTGREQELPFSATRKGVQEMSELPSHHPEQPEDLPNWSHVGAFLGLTFGLTWLLDLTIALHGGLGKPGVIGVIQLQMLFPHSVPSCFRRSSSPRALST